MIRYMPYLHLSAIKAEADILPLVFSPGYSVAVGEFSGDQVEGGSIKRDTDRK